MYNGEPPPVVPTADLAERGLLCALIKEPGPVHAFCSGRLELDVFYNELNRIIYEVVETWEEPELSIDWIWLKERLRTQTVYFSKFAATSDADQYLNAIYDLGVSGGVDAARFYLQDALEALNRRKTILLFEQISTSVRYSNNNFHQALCYVKSQIEILDQSTNGASQEKIYLEALKPKEISAYQPPPGTLLIGDNHIVRGAVFVIGGAPGIGKSRSSVALAEAGATSMDWLGLQVHTRFKTLIIQNENGRYRLKLEFEAIDTLEVLDDYLLITPPPPFGLRFEKQEFREQLKRIIDEHQPGLIMIDPWNAVVRDDKAKDYSEGFDMIRSVIPSGSDSPAIGIIAHTRKPQANERANGRALLNLLAGSYMLTSIPRSVWIMQHASDDVAENRVVVTCCKNNDGKELGPRSVWNRDNGLWTRCEEEFEWEAWDNPNSVPAKAQGVTLTAVASVLGHDREMTKEEAVAELMELTGFQKTACYKALDLKGKFREHLQWDKRSKTIKWR